ncbi:MAG: sigma-70 family RNA polymerase sigma factor [Clostridiaceae bacterium]|nr:sigma-70 family RNA polymerase sigma factor [Clostridiaceae bacterium]
MGIHYKREKKRKLELLYLTYRRLMFHVAYGILKDEGLAEDAVHQAFLKILENFDKVGDILSHKSKSYVVTIVRNVAINMYNSRKRHSIISLEETKSCIDVGNLEPTDDLNSLVEAVMNLTIIYKDVIKLKYIHEFSSIEIARVLGISEMAVRKRIERAKRMLAEILGGEGDSDED